MNDIIPLFSTPLYFSNIENIDYEEIFNQLNTVSFKESRIKLSLSTDEYVIDRVPKLKQNIVKHLNTYLFDRLCLTPIDYYFSDSWFVRISPGGNSSKHPHANSMYSGVVYFDVPDIGGEIKFYSTQINNTLNTIKHIMEYKENNIYNSHTWSIKPKRGDILIFPSFIFHEVSTNESNSDRYSFAFNILPDNYKCRSILGARITER